MGWTGSERDYSRVRVATTARVSKFALDMMSNTALTRLGTRTFHLPPATSITSGAQLVHDSSIVIMPLPTRRGEGCLFIITYAFAERVNCDGAVEAISLDVSSK